MTETLYYVYVDYTTNGGDDPVPYYVGKGDERRIAVLRRNKKHENVAKKYGLDRRIVLTTEDERQALDEEARLIGELHTLSTDPEATSLACNFTPGGEGVTGINRRKIMLVDKDGQHSEFDSITSAAEFLGVVPAIVGRAASGTSRRSNVVNGYVVSFVPTDRPFTPHSRADHAINGSVVVEYDSDGKETRRFESIKVAAGELGVSRTVMLKVLHGTIDPARIPSAEGRSWRLLHGADRRSEMSQSHKDSIATSLRGKKKSDAHREKLRAVRGTMVVRSGADGTIVAKYRSMREAAEALNVSRTKLSKLIGDRVVLSDGTTLSRSDDEG